MLPWLPLLLLACAPDDPARKPAPDEPVTDSGLTPTTPTSTLPVNVLFVLADDLGADQVRSYRPTLDNLPRQPTLDRLAADGVRFESATVAPLCSPTRAALLTGRHPHQTGIGQAMNAAVGAHQLPPGEVTVAELVKAAPTPYATAAFGKWHLATPSSEEPNLQPNLQGFDHYAGSMGNLNGLSYYSWLKVTDGELSFEQTYATTDTIDDASRWIAEAPEPWFAWVALQAPHTPIEAPPDGLLAEPLPEDATDQDTWDAMVEAMDTELGRLLDSVPAPDRTVVIFLGDNGTTHDAIRDPFEPGRAKKTLFEGGIRVPLIVTGPGVPAGEVSEALVHAVDLFPTLAELTEADPAAVGGGTRVGHSLVPLWTDPADPGPREVVYSEMFGGLDGPPWVAHRWSARDRDHKVVGYETEDLGQVTLLYDLSASEWDEGLPIVQPDPDQQAAREALAQAYAQWLDATPWSPVSP